MKKSIINGMKTDASKVQSVYNHLNYGNYDRLIMKWHQFNHCNAYTSEPHYNAELDADIILIKSYNTIVGIVNLDTKEVVEVGKYSVTTSKQFTQIHRQLFPSYDRYFIAQLTSKYLQSRQRTQLASVRYYHNRRHAK